MYSRSTYKHTGLAVYSQPMYKAHRASPVYRQFVLYIVLNITKTTAQQKANNKSSHSLSLFNSDRKCDRKHQRYRKVKIIKNHSNVNK